MQWKHIRAVQLKTQGKSAVTFTVAQQNLVSKIKLFQWELCLNFPYANSYILH